MAPARVDTVSYEAAKAGVTASLANPLVNKGEAGGDFYFSVENLTGSSFADKLVGDARANVLDGGPGGDRLEGGLGSDTASYARATAGVTADLTKSANNTRRSGRRQLSQHREPDRLEIRRPAGWRPKRQCP